MSVRQQIVEDLTRRLLLIAPGYVFQLPGGTYTCQDTVNRADPWRENPYTVSDLPAVAYRDGVVDRIYPSFGQEWYRLKVIMAAYVPGASAASRARGLLQDMAAAVGSDPRCGGLALRTDPDSAILDIRQGGTIIAGARLAFTVTYVPGRGEGISEHTLTANREILLGNGYQLMW